MFLCEEEGTWSSFQGVRETIEAKVKVRRHADGTLSIWHGPGEGA